MHGNQANFRNDAVRFGGGIVLRRFPTFRHTSFRGGIYRSTADGASMSTTNLAENAAPPAALPAPPLVPSSKMEEDTESARGGLRPPHHGCCHDFLRHNKLTVATIAAVVAGITLGVLLRPLGPFSKRNIMYINFPGEVFLRMLRGLILPLITSSMVAAVGSLDARLSGKIGLRAVVYYFTTTFMAIVLGIVLVLAIQPGSGDSKMPASGTSKARLVTTADTLMDLIRRETGLAFSLTVRKKGRIWFSTLVIQPTGNASNSK
ncbi:excitatory amino acid transporter 3 [Ixodes scapularis]